MNIAIGSDHRGDIAAARLIRHLQQGGHEVTVSELCGGKSCDYPDSAWVVGLAVAEGRAERGVLLCGSGIGMSIAANKVPGVRAALAFNETDVVMSRRHNDANVLCISADACDDVENLVDIWLATAFDGVRHQRRVDKIHKIEAECRKLKAES